MKRLWTCSMFVYFPLGPKPRETDSAGVFQVIDGQAVGDLFESLRPRLEALPRRPGPGRIYLTRKDSQHRRLVNRREVEDWFRSQSFEIVDPGELPFAEQLALVRGADLIVGPDGSGLWSSFLARPGTGVGYLNNPYLEHHWWIAGAVQAAGPSSRHPHRGGGQAARGLPEVLGLPDRRRHAAGVPRRAALVLTPRPGGCFLHTRGPHCRSPTPSRSASTTCPIVASVRSGASGTPTRQGASSSVTASSSRRSPAKEAW